MLYISWDVWWLAGGTTVDPGALMPISRWGPVEMPTFPHPTAPMGWPALTWSPTFTLAPDAAAECP